MRWFRQTEQENGKDPYGILFLLKVAMAIGLVFIFLYALRYSFTPSHGVTILGAGVLGAGASLFVGFLLGFIFCIPRTPNRNNAPANPGAGGTASGTQPVPSSAAPPSSSVQTNSNLEEISDWLTKIIVGVGLVELSKIPGKLNS